MKSYMVVVLGLAVAASMSTAAFAQGTASPREGPKGSGTAICHFEPDANGGGTIHEKNILFGPVPTDRGPATVDHDTLAESGELCVGAPTAVPTSTPGMPQNAATATATTLATATATATPPLPTDTPTAAPTATAAPTEPPTVTPMPVPTGLPDTGDGTTYAP